MKSGIKRYKCLSVLAVIRIARPQMPFHSVHCGFVRPVFSLRGQGKELDSINQTIDFVGFPFKVQGGSTGVSGRVRVEGQLNYTPILPLAE